MRIIADTSIWIEYFKGNPKIVSFLEENLISNNLYINGIIIAELIQGVKNEKETEAIRSNISAVPYVDIQYKDWIGAGNLSNQLRKKGITIPLTDIAIAAAAINNGMSVATLDKHFTHIPGLSLYANLITDL